MQFSCDMDNAKDLVYIARCPRCGYFPSDPDIERIYHIMDSIETLEQRNIALHIIKISPNLGKLSPRSL